MGTTKANWPFATALRFFSILVFVGIAGAPNLANAQLGGTFSERKTCDNLVSRGREMLQQNNLELASWYLEKAEKLNVEYDGIISRWKDTPAKLRIDVNKAIAEAQKGVPAAPPEPSASRTGTPAPSNPPRSNSPSPSQLYQPSSLPLPTHESVAPLAHGGAPRPVAPIGSTVSNDPTVVDANSYRNERLAEMTDDAKRRALKYLSQARSSLQAGNKIAAIGYYRACVSCRAEFTLADRDSPNRLAIDLQNAGVDVAQLHVASSDPRPAAHRVVPSTSPAPSAPGHWDKKRDAAVKRLAEATAAIDRGDLELAEKLALEAQDLRVPDEAFHPKDKRPWMVLMEVSRQRNRTTPVANASANQNRTIKLTAGQAPLEPSVESRLARPSTGSNLQQEFDANILSESPDPIGSDGLSPTELDDFLTTEELSPLNRERQNTVQLREVPNARPSQIVSPPRAVTERSGSNRVVSSPGAPLPSHNGGSAQHLFDQGVTALRDHNTERAWRLFVEAWQNQEQLTPATRDQLQGYLQSFAANAAEDAAEQSRAPVGSQPSASDADRAALSKFIGEITREQAAVRQLRETRPDEAWERLKQLRSRVEESQIEESAKERLLVRVDRSMTEMESYIDENRSMIELEARNRAVLEEIERRQEQRAQNQQQLASFVEQFNTLMDQQRFPEAEVVARKAREIDPTSPVTQNMIWKTQFARQVVSTVTRSERFSDRWTQHQNGILDSAMPFPDNLIQEFPDAREWSDLTANRRRFLEANKRNYTEEEIEIQKALKRKVDVEFDDVPLYQALEDLAKMSGINVFLDPAGLDAHGITRETPVAISLRKPVSLKSALNLILEPLELSYVIEDEVLRVTSELVRDSDVIPVTYNVADLVYPIPNYAPSYDMGLPGAIREAHETAARALSETANLRRGNTELLIGESAQGGVATPSSASALAQLGQSGELAVVGGAGYNSSPNGFGPGGPGGGSQADFDTLTDLITTTVEPETWEELGGVGTLQGFPVNLSLVVSQTQEVHEKIADLLAQLRRLQDLQVTIEVRFITLNDDFFERIGVDFDFEVDDNTGLTANQADRLAGNQGNFDDGGPSVTIGLDPVTNLPRADLDIRFDQGSFGITQPTFGGFDVESAANIGFAILSDIEAFFVIQAAQGDRRSNVLQAPKVTLFNGQQAFVSDASQRPFVTSVIPVVGDFAAAHQPVITVLTEGTSLSVQAIVSNDRRFVRLTLVPFFSRIGDVDTFQFNGRTDSDTGTNTVDPADETSTVTNNIRQVNEGTTVQLPTFAFTTVNTTVSVPDGGTILLGGIKRLSEGRVEHGVPMLSKLPYVNRLFRNVGVGRETSSLMMMVTPRIIIQEEEEANVLGGIGN